MLFAIHPTGTTSSTSKSSSSNKTAAESGGSSSQSADLLDAPSSSSSAAAATAQQHQVEGGAAAGLERSNTNSTNHSTASTSTSTTDSVSVVSVSSNSNSASSMTVVAAEPPLLTPMTTSTTTTTTTTTPLFNMNSSSMQNLLNREPRHNNGSFHSLQQQQSLAVDMVDHASNPFPTLLQVRQQSESQLQNGQQQQQQQQGQNKRRLLSQEQKATLERVTRLSARLLGLPVAVITGTSSSSSSTSSSPPQVICEHGLEQVHWKEQALTLLQQQQQQQSSTITNGMPFCQHVPLVAASGASVGTLSLMTAETRPPLTQEEEESLEDLAFLATQVLSKLRNARRRRSTAASIKALEDDDDQDSSSFQVHRQVSNASAAENAPPSMMRRQRRRSFRNATSSSTTASNGNNKKRSNSFNTNASDEDNDPEDEQEEVEDPSKCLIACTAHDLLTPLMGLQLSLSLLQDDSKFVRHLEEQPHQRESFWTAWQSTEVMYRMCQTTIDTLRANKHNKQIGPQACPSATTTANSPPPPTTSICNLDLTVLLQSLQRLMDPIPKQVPLIITLPKHVPTLIPVVTIDQQQQQQQQCNKNHHHPHHLMSSISHSGHGNGNNSNTSSSATTTNTVDWNILRCALTVLSHACRVSDQQQPIHMRMALRKQTLVLECDHHDGTTQDCDSDDDSTTLALQSVAHQMQSVHGGQYGLERNTTDGRATFWFSVPVGAMTTTPFNRDDRVVTLMPAAMRAPQPTEQQQQQPSLPPSTTTSPPNQQRRLRRLRRSSTGSTNVLTTSRVRTFHDMAGLQNDTFGTTSSSTFMMTSSTSSSRLGTTIPSVLPTTLMPRSQSQYPPTTTSGTLSGHKRNFQYPNHGNNSSTMTTTANSAMAAAFQASLAASSALFSTSNSNAMDDDSSAIDRKAGGRSRLSYSLLQEQQQLDREEKLRPLQLQQQQQQQPHLTANPCSNTTTTSSFTGGGSGLDRCFQDLMGSSDQSTQRIRQRLLQQSSTPKSSSSSSGKPVLTSLGGAPRERKALVIEDSLVIRKTVARALTKKMGIHTVVPACDGVEGVARLKEEVFDIVLCDFSMPNLGGIECVQQYRQWEAQQQPGRRPKQYIVGMSAHASPSDIAQGLKVGMNEYRPKPLTIPRLTELMESPALQEMRKQLDAWRKQKATDVLLLAAASPTAKTGKAQRATSLFADFTNSTVSMLDAMNTASRASFSAAGGGDADHPIEGSLKRPKTEGLFSMITN